MPHCSVSNCYFVEVRINSIRSYNDIVLSLESDFIILSFFHIKELIIWEKMSFSFGQTHHFRFSFISFLCISTTYESKFKSKGIHSNKEDELGFPTWDFHNNSCLLGFWAICYLGTHAFSPGTSRDGGQGHSYCCDFGIIKDFLGVNPPEFPIERRALMIWKRPPSFPRMSCDWISAEVLLGSLLGLDGSLHVKIKRVASWHAIAIKFIQQK